MPTFLPLSAAAFGTSLGGSEITDVSGFGMIAPTATTFCPWSRARSTSGSYEIARSTRPAATCLIGAVFGEAAGAESGLGYLVLLDNHQLETPRAYAGVVLLAALAVGLFLLTALAERFAVPWNRREGDPAT